MRWFLILGLSFHLNLLVDGFVSAMSGQISLLGPKHIPVRD